MARPRFQVVISVKRPMAMTSGTQPPFPIFSEFDPKNARSTARNAMPSAIARQRGHCQRVSATTMNSTEVMAIVPVTAMPYAAPRSVEFLNASTMTRQPTIRA